MEIFDDTFSYDQDRGVLSQYTKGMQSRGLVIAALFVCDLGKCFNELLMTKFEIVHATLFLA